MAEVRKHETVPKIKFSCLDLDTRFVSLIFHSAENSVVHRGLIFLF